MGRSPPALSGTLEAEGRTLRVGGEEDRVLMFAGKNDSGLVKPRFMVTILAGAFRGAAHSGLLVDGLT